MPLAEIRDRAAAIPLTDPPSTTAPGGRREDRLAAVLPLGAVFPARMRYNDRVLDPKPPGHAPVGPAFTIALTGIHDRAHRHS
jgi:hypothetical protein